MRKFWNEYRRTVRIYPQIAIACTLLVILGIIHIITSVISSDQSVRVFGTIVGLVVAAIAVAVNRIVWCPEDDLLPAKRRK